MSILEQLERDLVDAARARAAEADSDRSAPAPSRQMRRRASGLRWALVAFGALLASATIALAASGVILTGTPVSSRAPRNPQIGNGVPARNGSWLLPLSAPDPEGGLPWGMRIVTTTRGEVCLQVGRLQDKQLGELGVDGAFHDDGRFHPLSAAVLPGRSRVGLVPPADANTSCQLAGKAVAAHFTGLDRSAAEVSVRSGIPRSGWRDVDYGLLGPQAVSVTYRAGARHVTVPVIAGAGAYLIVRRMSPEERPGYAGANIGTYGDLAPQGALSAITYRIEGKLCKRGPSVPPWVKRHLADECPSPRWPGRPSVTPDLHRPLHVRLDIHDGLITGMDVTFTAPLAVQDASHEYALRIPEPHCRKGEVGEGYGGVSLDRDVKLGSVVTMHALDPFTAFGSDCPHRSAKLQIVWEGREGGPSVLVGSATVREPPGTRPAPPPRIHRRWASRKRLLRHSR